MLDNDWIVVGYFEGSSSYTRFKISKDNGTTFEFIDKNFSPLQMMDFSMCSIGNIVYISTYQYDGSVKV